jgi:hypothetical protein
MKLCAGFLLALCVGFISTAAQADTPFRNYDGPDGGWIVFSITTQNKGTSGYGGSVLVHLHRVGGHGQWGDPLSKTPDATAPGFDSKTLTLAAHRGPAINGPTETRLYVFRQPPGAYEIYDFGVTYAPIIFQKFNGPIPISVSAGATTYVGAFTFVPVRQNVSFANRLMTGAANFGWALVVNDRSDRDLEIARRKVPDLGPVTPGVPALSAAR